MYLRVNACGVLCVLEAHFWGENQVVRELRVPKQGPYARYDVAVVEIECILAKFDHVLSKGWNGRQVRIDDCIQIRC